MALIMGAETDAGGTKIDVRSLGGLELVGRAYDLIGTARGRLEELPGFARALARLYFGAGSEANRVVAGDCILFHGGLFDYGVKFWATRDERNMTLRRFRKGERDADAWLDSVELAVSSGPTERNFTSGKIVYEKRAIGGGGSAYERNTGAAYEEAVGFVNRFGS